MALYTVPLPSVDGGDEDISRQMRKIIGYLRQLDEQLKYVLCNLDGENLSDSFRAVIDSSTDAAVLDELTGNIANLSTEIKQTAQAITLKASRADLNALGDRVSEAESTLTVQAGQIEGKVSQTAFDQLSGQVTQVQSTVTQQANQISSKVSQSDFDDFAETVLTKDSFEVNIDGENQLHVGEDGVSAQSVTAPNVAAAYDGPSEITVNPNYTDAWLEAQEGKAVRSLQQALDKINGKRLMYNVSITMDNTSHYERVDIHGVTGSGVLEVLGNGSTFYGGIAVQYCTAKVSIMGTGMTVYAGTGKAIEVTGCSFVRIDGANVSGSGTDGVYYTEGSKGLLWNCDFAGFTNAVHASLTAHVIVNACTGSGALKASFGGIVAANGTMPTGGTTEVGNGKVWSSGSTATGGSTSASSSTLTAASYDAVTTATCRNSGSWTSGQLRQNFVTGLGVCKGCVWFDNSAIRSALSGKTVRSATLRLHRVSGSGRSSAVQVTARGLTLTGASGTVPNSTSASVYGGLSAMLGTIGNGETVAMALPVKIVNALVSGSINGIALYAGETAQTGNRGFSANYCRFDGVGDQFAPVLTINYL